MIFYLAIVAPAACLYLGTAVAAGVALGLPARDAVWALAIALLGDRAQRRRLKLVLDARRAALPQPAAGFFAAPMTVRGRIPVARPLRAALAEADCRIDMDQAVRRVQADVADQASRLARLGCLTRDEARAAAHWSDPLW
jgi:hypothetical protein